MSLKLLANNVIEALREISNDNQIQKKIVDILANNSGKILKKEDWGIRNLAYPIKKNVKGIYQNLYFETDGKAVKEIEYFERYNDKIIKFLSIKLKNIPKEDSQLKKA